MIGETTAYLLLFDLRLWHAKCHILIGAINSRLGSRNSTRSRSQALLLSLNGFCSRVVGQRILSRTQELFDLIFCQIRHYCLSHDGRCGGREQDLSWERNKRRSVVKVFADACKKDLNFFLFSMDLGWG